MFHPARLCSLLFDFIIGPAGNQRGSLNRSRNASEPMTASDEFTYSEWREVVQLQVSDETLQRGTLIVLLCTHSICIYMTVDFIKHMLYDIDISVFN